MEIKRIETILGWSLYLIGMLLLFKLIDSETIAIGFISFAMGMLFLGRSTN
jgi:hypothetical protein